MLFRSGGEGGAGGPGAGGGGGEGLLAPAHPHMRGDYAKYLLDELKRELGPSPHAWGLRWGPEEEGEDSTGPSPHAWGLRLRARRCSGVMSGPSPHAWGLRRFSTYVLAPESVHPHTRGDYQGEREEAARVGRSIPTRVGTTGSRWRPSPRASGPSPHAWGLPRFRTLTRRSWSVHPHTRGDYFSAYRRVEAGTGPSPHAWGLRRAMRRALRMSSGPSPHAWGLRL